MARGVRADPVVDRVHARVLVRGGDVERDDAAGDDGDLRRLRRGVHRLELALGRLRAAALIHVVHAGDDHHEGGLRLRGVSREARADLIRALAVDAPVQHLPAGMRLHQPVGILTFDISRSVRRRFDRRCEGGRAGGGGITERDDCDHHGQEHMQVSE